MTTTQLHLFAGWGSMLLGTLSGAVLGLFFHRPDWAGGYGAFRRRLLRLGHIAFFGLGMLNVLFGLSLTALALPEVHTQVSSTGFLLAAATMPLCCFLAAWRAPLRRLFPVPVLAAVAGVAPILLGGLTV